MNDEHTAVEKMVHDAKNIAQAAAAAIEVANTNPTNADLKDLFDKHAIDDRAFQDNQDKVNEEAADSRVAIHKRLNEIPTKAETAEIVEAVIRDLLLSKGKIVYKGIIGASILIGALIVIFGGFKTVLGWLGFVAIVK